MDIFKLLTRSTNLRKPSAVAKISVNQNIPSAGGLTIDNKNDSIQGADSIVQGKGSVQSKKRKRGESQDQAAADSAIGVGGYEESIPGAALGEEERKKSLKFHKLKVALVEHTETSSLPKRHKRISKAQEVSQKDAYTQIYPRPLTSFDELRTRYKISKRIAENIREQGYKVPTEVQMGALPLLLGPDDDLGLNSESLEGDTLQERTDVDLMTVAPTGSGKTLAFLIPVLNSLLQEKHVNQTGSKSDWYERGVKAIIIAPTHELADQIVNEAKKLALGVGIKISGMRKGMALCKLSTETTQEGGEDSGVLDETTEAETPCAQVKADILVSTPLILLHALSPETAVELTALPSVTYLVLDEADVLLDSLFREQTLAIWQACNNPALKTSFWSATIGSSIESLVQKVLYDRRQKLRLSISTHRTLRLIVGLKDSSIPTISHRLVYAGTEQGKLLALRQLLHPTSSTSDKQVSLRPPFLVFTQTIPRAIALHSELLYDIPVEAGGSSRIAVLHSNLSDPVRASIMAGFRKGEIWILITTDLLSRGVDFRGINGVVNYDIPNTGASYVHRAGRTGRAGREGGVAVTLYTKEDIQYVKNIANVIAASQMAQQKESGFETGGVQKWLLDALPKVSKKTKGELKKKGVEMRRPARNDSEGKAKAGKVRISTKSGFNRRLENKRKGAVVGSRQRLLKEMSAPEDSDDEWKGIED
ncbi:MAG: RNA-dependent ATPase rok1 [Icmadophila ericetorum]|nr:RNA-dependent ATPase rok1 [Icmadophila ericetorum]